MWETLDLPGSLLGLWLVGRVVPDLVLRGDVPLGTQREQ